MNTATNSPRTVHEHAAVLSAIPVSSIAIELETRLRARHGAPAGFHLDLTAGDIREILDDPDWCGEWDGPTIPLENCKITTGWNPATGVYFFVDHEGDDPWPISQASVLGAAIESLAGSFKPDYGVELPVPRKAEIARSLDPINCESWCWQGTGHPDEFVAADQHCWSDTKKIPLSTHNAKAPADEPDILELYMHRPNSGGGLVVGINPDRVRRDSEFTKAEWDHFVRSGNELWEAAA